MGTIRDPRVPPRFLRFLHKRLGLKNLADHIEQRQTLLGLVHLDIRTVIDVGANRGLSARDSLRVFPDAHVHCIEPIPALCQVVEEWARRQGSAITVRNLALSRAPGEATLYVDRRNDIWSTLMAPSPERDAQYERISVRVETLDRVMAEIEIHGDVLVKIDTEGWDLEVIRGGQAALRRAAAVMVESVFYPNPLGAGAPTFEDISGALRDLGYVYRGSVRVGCRRGVPMLADVLFLRREAAERLVARGA